MRKLARRLVRLLLRIVALIVAVIATIWVLRGLASRALPDLEIWHTYETTAEFRASDYPNGISFGEYRELEERLAAEIEEHVYATVEPNDSEIYNRYNQLGRVYAGAAEQDWNRSLEIDTPNATGGILLLHGASDSPYSMRALAQTFSAHGLYVAAFRLPGHGTIPSGLKNAEVEDWVAIVRSGAKHVAGKVGDLPLYVAGYSSGAALAIDYALDAVLDQSLRMPDRLFLYSPSIAVTPLARFSNWDLTMARIPFFRKMAWLSVMPEFDPYKYNSFPKNGGYLAYELAKKIASKLDRLDNADGGRSLPPMIAFQSLVDSTVLTESLVHDLYLRLPDNEHELILFDINRAETIQHFIRDRERDLLTALGAAAPSNFDYTLVTNRDEQTTQIQARTRPRGTIDIVSVDLPLSWPGGVYSLSHVAIPFDSSDAWYGVVDEDGEPRAGTISAMAPRGERAILTVPIAQLMRLRYNPFFAYLEQRTLAFCEACF